MACRYPEHGCYALIRERVVDDQVYYPTVVACAGILAGDRLPQSVRKHLANVIRVLCVGLTAVVPVRYYK